MAAMNEEPSRSKRGVAKTLHPFIEEDYILSRPARKQDESGLDITEHRYDIRNLLGHKILLWNSAYDSDNPILETRVLEFSPNGEYVKLQKSGQNLTNGMWKQVKEQIVLDDLEALSDLPPGMQKAFNPNEA